METTFLHPPHLASCAGAARPETMKARRHLSQAIAESDQSAVTWFGNAAATADAQAADTTALWQAIFAPFNGAYGFIFGGGADATATAWTFSGAGSSISSANAIATSENFNSEARATAGPAVAMGES